MKDKTQIWAYELAKRFAPYIVFHKEDKYRPCSVEWFFQRCELKTANKQYIKTLKPDHLINFNHEEARLVLRGEHHRDGCLEHAQVYVHLRNAPRDAVTTERLYDIQYWVFYPFNGEILKNRIGEHEGDWEHITIRLKNVFTNPRVDSVFYSAHGKGSWEKPEKGQLFPKKDAAFLENGERPYAFAAKHSHAFYEAEGNHRRLLVLHDKTNQGEKWDTQNQLVIISDSFSDQYQIFLETGQVPDITYDPIIRIAKNHLWWMSFKGIWGKHSNSPVGPLVKRVWSRSLNNDNVKWIEDEDNDKFDIV